MRHTKLENGWWDRSFESYPEEQMEPTTANVRITMVLLASSWKWRIWATERWLMPGVCTRDHPITCAWNERFGCFGGNGSRFRRWSCLDHVAGSGLCLMARSCYFFDNFQSDRIFKHGMACEQFCCMTLSQWFLVPTLTGRLWGIQSGRLNLDWVPGTKNYFAFYLGLVIIDK